MPDADPYIGWWNGGGAREVFLYIFGRSNEMPCKLGSTTRPKTRRANLRSSDRTLSKIDTMLRSNDCDICHLWRYSKLLDTPHLDERISGGLDLPRIYVRGLRNGGGTWPQRTEWFDVTPEEMVRALSRSPNFQELFGAETAMSVAALEKHSRFFADHYFDRLPHDLAYQAAYPAYQPKL